MRRVRTSSRSPERQYKTPPVEKTMKMRQSTPVASTQAGLNGKLSPSHQLKIYSQISTCQSLEELVMQQSPKLCHGPQQQRSKSLNGHLLDRKMCVTGGTSFFYCSVLMKLLIARLDCAERQNHPKEGWSNRWKSTKHSTYRQSRSPEQERQ